MNPTQIVSTMSPKKYRIPKDLEMVHAYHPLSEELVKFNTKLSIENLKLNQTTKLKLFTKQKGICEMCNQTLLNSDGEFLYDGNTNIHHKELRSKGGSKSNIANLTLIHTQCHIAHHKKHR